MCRLQEPLISTAYTSQRPVDHETDKWVRATGHDGDDSTGQTVQVGKITRISHVPSVDIKPYKRSKCRTPQNNKKSMNPKIKNT